MAYTKEQVIEMFLKDMQGAPSRALYYSFKKYATLRDELIEEYSRLTGIPEDEFTLALSRQMVLELNG